VSNVVLFDWMIFKNLMYCLNQLIKIFNSIDPYREESRFHIFPRFLSLFSEEETSMEIYVKFNFCIQNEDVFLIRFISQLIPWHGLVQVVVVVVVIYEYWTSGRLLPLKKPCFFCPGCWLFVTGNLRIVEIPDKCKKWRPKRRSPQQKHPDHGNAGSMQMWKSPGNFTFI